MADPNDALAELKQQGEAKYDPGPPPIFATEPPQPPHEGFRYEPPDDWFEHDRGQRVREAEAEPAAPEPEPAKSLQPRPAKPTPRLDKVKRMLAKGSP